MHKEGIHYGLPYMILLFYAVDACCSAKCSKLYKHIYFQNLWKEGDATMICSLYAHPTQHTNIRLNTELPMYIHYVVQTAVA